MMGEASGSNSVLALANESSHEIIPISPSIVCELVGSSVDQSEGSSIVGRIEKSKSHWSQLREFDSTNEVVEVSNLELFQSWQRHPAWGTFFRTFGEGDGSYGELVMGKKFAEGGQAELYEVQIKEKDPKDMEHVQEKKIEWVLKVFKKGTSLRHLQSKWPQGMFQHHVNKLHHNKLGLPQETRFYCNVHCATLLEDGRFAFVMVKKEKDLRSMIDKCMLTRPNNKGPFSKDDVELMMYEIAYGMDQLHGQGIVQRDIKASNVLISMKMNFLIAEFECSVGVVGTGFFRAPEILEACKHGVVHHKANLFTKAIDVYSYRMTCYEMLTGKLPFEGHPQNDYNLVLEGQRPELLEDVDDWICKLLRRCWQSNPLTRPSFGEILKILLANSRICRDEKLFIER